MSRIEKSAKTLLFSFLRLFIHVRRVGTIPRASVQRILIIRQHNQLGDMLCAVPLFRALRATYPRSYIALLARPLNSEVLRGAPYLDEIIVYDKVRFLRNPLATLSFIRSLRKRNFDLALVPSTVSMSVTSDALCFLSGARRRIGPGSLAGVKNLTGFFYHVPVDLDWRRDPTRHQTERNIDVSSILVLDRVSLDLEIGLLDDEQANARRMLDEHRGGRDLVIGLHPGAAKPQNRWDALRFAEIANRCAEIFGAFLVITAGPDDDEHVREMTMNVPNEFFIVRAPVRAAAAIVQQCAVYITNDTGMMHVAAAVGTPTISLFGPTDPLQWAPTGPRHRFILGMDQSVHTISVNKVWAVLTELLEDIATPG